MNNHIWPMLSTLLKGQPDAFEQGEPIFVKVPRLLFQRPSGLSRHGLTAHELWLSCLAWAMIQRQVYTEGFYLDQPTWAQLCNQHSRTTQRTSFLQSMKHVARANKKAGMVIGVERGNAFISTPLMTGQSVLMDLSHLTTIIYQKEYDVERLARAWAHHHVSEATSQELRDLRRSRFMGSITQHEGHPRLPRWYGASIRDDLTCDVPRSDCLRALEAADVVALVPTGESYAETL